MTVTAHPLTFDPLEDLAAALRAAGIRSVSTDPAEVTPPGVWLQVDPVAGIEFDVLDGFTIHTSIHVLAADLDTRRTMAALAELANIVTTVLDPTGPIVPAAVVLPEHPAGVPALTIPHALLAT